MRTVPTPSQRFQLMAPGAHGAAATQQRPLTLCARGAGLRFTPLTDWFPVDLSPQEYTPLLIHRKRPRPYQDLSAYIKTVAELKKTRFSNRKQVFAKLIYLRGRSVDGGPGQYC